MDEPRYTLALNKCTGLLFYGSYYTYQKTGTYDELKEEFKKVQRHNKIFGWWFGLFPFVNYRFIKANKFSMAQLDELHNSRLRSNSTPIQTINTEATAQPQTLTSQSVLSAIPSEGKKSKKKKVLIVLAIIVGVITLLALIPAPPEDSNSTQNESKGAERIQPPDTTLQRFAAQKFEIAIPRTWEESSNFEVQNTDSDASESELNKIDLYKLYLDKSYIASDESPTIYMQADKHNYVDDEVAMNKIDDLEKEISNQNGHNVPVKKEEVQVGRFSKYKGYLYTYEDTFDKTTKEKLRQYRLYTVAHGHKYFAAGFHSAHPEAAKYETVIRQSVLSLNPDE